MGFERLFDFSGDVTDHYASQLCHLSEILISRLPLFLINEDLSHILLTIFILFLLSLFFDLPLLLSL